MNEKKCRSLEKTVRANNWLNNFSVTFLSRGYLGKRGGKERRIVGSPEGVFAWSFVAVLCCILIWNEERKYWKKEWVLNHFGFSGNWFIF